jgi:hypothetical protein
MWFSHMLGWYTMSTYRKCLCQWSRICGSVLWMPIACTKNIYDLSCIEKVGWTMIFGCPQYVLFAFKVGHGRRKRCQGWGGFCAHCPLLAWVGGSAILWAVSSNLWAVRKVKYLVIGPAISYKREILALKMMM